MKSASAKSWSAKGASHSPAGFFTAFTIVCLAYLVDELVFVFYTLLC